MTDEPRVTRVIEPGWGKPGPVHAKQDARMWSLAWCGMAPQYRHRDRPGTEIEVTCAKCLTALRQNQPRAWRRR